MRDGLSDLANVNADLKATHSLALLSISHRRDRRASSICQPPAWPVGSPLHGQLGDGEEASPALRNMG